MPLYKHFSFIPDVDKHAKLQPTTKFLKKHHFKESNICPIPKDSIRALKQKHSREFNHEKTEVKEGFVRAQLVLVLSWQK